MRTTFSFVLPAYKASNLEEAMQSILNQTYPHFELIIVNDCSPENVDGVVAKFADSRIKYYVNRENIGGQDLVKQWNYCIGYATNDYLILASDDDFYGKDFLLHANALIEKYPAVDLIRGRVKKVNYKGEIVEKDPLLEDYTTCQDFLFYWSKVTCHCIANYIFKTSELKNRGGFVNFPVAWFSDDATILQNSINGVAYINHFDFFYRISEETLSSTHSALISTMKADATEKFDEWFQQFVSLLGDKSELLKTAIRNTRVRNGRMLKSYLTPYSYMKCKDIFKGIFSSKLLTKKDKYELFFILLTSYPLYFYMKKKYKL